MVHDADVVLRSSDFVTFRVHKSILASSSQFFKDMFSLPQPPDSDMVDGLSVVPLSEDAEIVRGLITMVYPIFPEIPASYEKVLALLGAAEKYDMPSVLYSIRAEVAYERSTAPVMAHPLRAYAIAFSSGLEDETRTAARLALDYPLTFEALGDDLPLFSGSALRSLAEYRKKCRDSVVSCLELFLDVRSNPSNIWVGCPRTKTESGRPWWLHSLFTEEIKASIQYFNNSLLQPSSIREKYLAALMKHAPDKHCCMTCLLVHAHKGERYCSQLEQLLTRARNRHNVRKPLPAGLGN